MEKTKLGITTGLLGFIAYVLGGYSSLWVVALLMIFVLMTEADVNLRVNVVQATVMAALFTLAFFCLSGLSSLGSMLEMSEYYRLDNIFRGIVNIAEIVFFLLAAIQALSNKVMTIPIVTPMVQKHFASAAE